MKVFLLHRDRDIDVKPELRDDIYKAMHSGDLFALTRVRRERAREHQPDTPPLPECEAALAQDLELTTLWRVMANGDEFLYETAKRVVLSGLSDADAIVYRQRVLADCLKHPAVVRRLYELAIEALENDRKVVGGLLRSDRPDTILYRSVNVLKLHVDVLKRVRQIAEEEGQAFGSEGFTRLFATLREELADDYLATVERHLRELAFKRGPMESAELGEGDKGRNYIVRTPRERHWTERLPFGNRDQGYTFTIPPRDEAGFQALAELRNRGINRVANAAGQAADHIKSFFAMMRLELAFYLACLNLHQALADKGVPACVPTPLPEDQDSLAAHGLYDVCLTLHLAGQAVGNDLAAHGKSLVMITGANQGGKSTLLRSIGLAQLMMQAGMFVGAQSFRANICPGIYTHYKREEDADMKGGKLDEELSRMSRIADAIAPRSLLLCNESFAATNEREGSEIARQMIRALLAKRIKVVFVTHMYDLAHGFQEQHLDNALFLRAERQPDGRRTFKLTEAAPLPTSYGEDSYRRIFGQTMPSPVSAEQTTD